MIIEKTPNLSHPLYPDGLHLAMIGHEREIGRRFVAKNGLRLILSRSKVGGTNAELRIDGIAESAFESISGRSLYEVFAADGRVYRCTEAGDLAYD